MQLGGADVGWVEKRGTSQQVREMLSGRDEVWKL